MASPSLGSMLPLLRRAAPRLSQEFFTCRPCLRQGLHVPQSLARRPISSSAVLRLTRSGAVKDVAPSVLSNKSSPLSELSQTWAKPAVEGVTAKSFPKISSKTVGYWLIGSAVSVFGIVVFGGLTRLTESGLSITEWKPVTGSLPPMSNEDWESEFAKYRASPEFKQLNAHMTLSEFKNIYYMEWIHRLWGRFVGLSFVIPAVYFVARRRVSKSMALRLGGIAGLIGFQGFIGWWMVKSGLKDDLFEPGAHPRVSQYRLTAHLGAAFLCYTAMLWNGLAILRQNRLLSNPEVALKELNYLQKPKFALFRRSVAGLAVMIFVTAMSGALVAGLDAGLIYNEFPRMGLGFHPPKSELLDNFYSHRDDRSDLVWRNMLENPSLVQLDHRALAMTTFTAICTVFAYARFAPSMRKNLPAPARKGIHGVLGFAIAQVSLGIATLIYMVPLPLASMHQGCSLLLLSWTLILGSRIWHPSRTAKLVQEALKGRGLITKTSGQSFLATRKGVSPDQAKKAGDVLSKA